MWGCAKALVRRGAARHAWRAGAPPQAAEAGCAGGGGGDGGRVPRDANSLPLASLRRKARANTAPLSRAAGMHRADPLLSPSPAGVCLQRVSAMLAPTVDMLTGF